MCSVVFVFVAFARRGIPLTYLLTYALAQGFTITAISIFVLKP
jgi:hypothetical protein